MAARYWSGNQSATSTNWNYNTGGTNWGSASGVADDVSVPTSTDDVTFDGAGALGNSNSTISATITCLSLTITAGYTGTMTHNASLTIAGNWTMNNTHTIAGSSSIGLSATCTITSNGQTWPNGLTFSGGATTKTLSGNFTIGGSLTVSWLTTSTFSKTASETFTCVGISCSAGSSFFGTVSVTVTGGSITGGNAINNITNPIILAGGSISLGNVNFSGGLAYVSGTISPGASVIAFGGGTVDTNGITWGNISIRGTILLASDLTVPGVLTIETVSTPTINKTTSETVIAQGGLVVSKPCAGTAKIILTGGTWSGTDTTGVSNDIDLQGNVTISGVVYYKTGTLKYVSGTITVTSSTLRASGNFTLDSTGMSWSTILPISFAITLQSDAICLSLFASNGGGSINGAYVMTCSSCVYTQNISGSATIRIIAGSWSQTGTRTCTINIILDGNVTISGTVLFHNATLTYTSGTITTTSSTLQIGRTTSAGNVTLDVAGVTWNNITVTGSFQTTLVLLSNLNVPGTFLTSITVIITETTSETLNVSGVLNITGPCSGTAKIIVTAGSIAFSGGPLSNDLDLQGNISITNMYYGAGTLRYVSGTITHSGTLTILSGTYDTSGVQWDSVVTTTTAAQNFIINSDFNANSLTLAIVAVQTFSGANGFIVGTLSCAGTSSQTINLKESITYTITASFACSSSRVGSIVLFTSSHASTKALIYMPNNGSNLCNVLASFTRIDASGGRSICTFGGVLTDTVNIVQYYDYNPVAL